MPSGGGNALRAALACTLAFGLIAGAEAEVGSAPDTATWVTDGPVYAIARAGDRTFIGGDFSYVGQRTGPGVPLAPVGAANAGKPSPTYGSFPEVSGGRVMDVQAAPDGSWYIGGDFTHVGGVAHRGLAHLVTDSSGALAVDGGFAAQVDGPVHALALGAISGKDDHVLYAGGKFTSINGDVRIRNLAALDRNSGKLALLMASPDDTVRSIDVLRQDATGTSFPVVFIAGPFGNVGATAKARLAALWGVGAGAAKEGQLATSFVNSPNDPAASVRAVHVGQATWNSTTTKTTIGAPVYVGGGFGFATFKFTVTIATGGEGGGTFVPNPDPSFACNGCAPVVRSIATSADGSTLYIGGRFDTVSPGAVARRNLVAIRGIPNVHVAAPPFVVRPWDPSPDGRVDALTPTSGDVYIGGSFTQVRDAAGGFSPRVGLAALSPSVNPGATNPNDAGLRNWDPIASGVETADTAAVSAVGVSSTSVYAGGSFASVGGSRHENVAALDSSGRPIESWTASTDGRVNALAVGNDRVYLGGRFDNANGQPRTRLAAVDALGGGALDGQFSPAAEPACTGPGCTRSEVFALSLRDSALYVGGAFARLAGAPRTNTGAVDAGSGAALGWTPNPDGNVYSLLATCGTVYAGGGFSQAGGKARRRLAALDPGTGEATAWNPSVEAGSAVRAIARDLDVVYVGGNFGKVGGKERQDLAALDAASGDATSWNPSVPRAGEEVWAINAPPGGSVVYVGGRFTRAGRADRSNVAALDRGSGDATTWNPGADAPVRALAADDGSLAVGGDFRQFGPLMQQGFASFGLGSGTATGALRCEPPTPPPAPQETKTAPPAPRVPSSERAADTTPPRLAHVRLSHRRFRTARRAEASADSGAHVGTTFKYGLSERAVVRYTFKRKTRVRCDSAKWRRACESWPRGDTGIYCRSHRWQRRCYRWRRAGSIRHFSKGGRVRRQFDGRVGRRWLRPGQYRVRLRAADLAGNRSNSVRRRFKVVRR